MSQQASVPHARSVEVTTEVEPDTKPSVQDQFISSVSTRAAGLSTQHIVHSRRDAQQVTVTMQLQHYLSTRKSSCDWLREAHTINCNLTKRLCLLPWQVLVQTAFATALLRQLILDTVLHFLAPKQLSNLLLFHGGMV